MTAEHSPLPRTLSLAVHELRTPVTVVTGYLRMLLKEQGGPLNEKQRKMVEEAERSCARIGALVAEMSELGKLESHDVKMAQQPFDLAALAAELASDMHEGSDRGVQLEVRAAGGPVEVVGDRARLAAVLRALMHAALRERGEPGVIVAECSVETNPGPAAVFVVGEPEMLGALKEAADRHLPFDEFRGGLGMALPVARRVVEAHGGAIWSAPGERPRAGSAVRLPITR